MPNQKSSLLAVLTPSLRFFLAGFFLIELSGMYSLYMPLFISELGASPAEIGLVYTLAEVVPLGISIIGGWLSDRFGRLRTITWGNFLTLLSFALMLFADRWEWIILVFSFQGIGWALGGPSYSAYIADTTAERQRARVYAVQQNVRNAVNLVKFPLAGWVTFHFGFKAMLLAAAIIYLGGTILFSILSRGEKQPQQQKEDIRPVKSFRRSFAVILSALLAGGLFTWVFIIDHANDIFLGLTNKLQVLYFEEIIGLSVDQIGYFPTIGAVVALFVTIPLGHWVDKHGENSGLGLAYSLLAFHIGAPLLATGFWGLLPPTLAHPFMMGLAIPAYKSLISKAVPEDQLGFAFGLTLTSRGLVSLPAPYLGGLLWERVDPRAPFLVTVFGCLLLSVLAFSKLKIPLKAEPEPG
jgi:MFS family permease